MGESFTNSKAGKVDGKGDEDKKQKVILHAWEGTELVSQVGLIKVGNKMLYLTLLCRVLI